jgi:tetratricopeptide (TPR) repeat protein
MEFTAEPGRAAAAARAHLERGFRFEQGGTLDRALDAYREALAVESPPREQAEARLRIARVYRSLAQYEPSREHSSEAVRIAIAMGDKDLAAEAMNVEVGALQQQGRFEEADALAHQALEIAASNRVRGITLQNLGRGAAERRDFDSADVHFEASIAEFRQANYEIGLAIALANAAKSALDRGDARRSIEIGHEAIAITRRLNSLDILLSAVQNQAAAFLALQETDSAEMLLTEALGHFTSARNPIRQAECLEIMGEMSRLRGDEETARRCWARARELAIVASDHPLTARLDGRLAADAERGET